MSQQKMKTRPPALPPERQATSSGRTAASTGQLRRDVSREVPESGEESEQRLHSSEPLAVEPPPLALDVLGRIPLHPPGGYPTRERDQQMREVAQRGLQGPSQALPHLERIQASFGHHDMADVRAYIGGPASEAVRAVGARAYAMDGRVAFRAPPDLHTAAHEAAHVVQQRAGVRLEGGVGEVGDPHERHANAVADRVVQGGAAEGLLDRFMGSGGGSGGPVLQRQTAGASGEPPPPEKETQWNAKLDTSTDSLIQAFDETQPGKVSWNLDLLTAKAAIGLKSSPVAYVEVIGNWQPDVTKGTSSEVRDKALQRAQTVRKALQQWGAFPDERLRATSRSISIDGSAPPGSFHDVEVWFRTGTAAVAPSYVPASTAVQVPGGPPPSPFSSALPPATAKQLMDLADAIAAAGDAVTRDPLVRKLRDLVVKIQPFMPDPEMKKTLDDAIVKGVGEGIKAAIMAALKGITGKTATDVPSDPSRVGPAIAQKDLQEKIIKSPEIPLDKVPEVKRYSFEFNGLSSSYKAGAAIQLTVATPDDFEPTGSAGAGRVVILEAEDFKTNGGLKATTIASKNIEAKGKVGIHFFAPTKPGQYVLGIRVGLEFRSFPTFEFKVSP